MKIDIIVGARPNFIKVAPLIHELKTNKLSKSKHSFRLIHTGQHYDRSMSDKFFQDLNIPKPNYNLNCRSGTHAYQVGKIMYEYEKILRQKSCDLCIVVGDVNSTMACSVAAKKLNIKVAHIEAGLRSRDLSMPEEINRIITDSISDYFFTTSKEASNILISEGKKKNSIFFVGNIMIDSLLLNLSKLKQPSFYNKLIKSNKFIILTIHRIENVKNTKSLKKLLEKISILSKGYLVIYPVHPRVSKDISSLRDKFTNLVFLKPQSYLNFLYLLKNSKAVITDSGGITEEASILNIPCITLRSSTERPETIKYGTNVLVGNDVKKISKRLKRIFQNKWKKSNKIDKWDGKTSKRIVKILNSF